MLLKYSFPRGRRLYASLRHQLPAIHCCTNAVLHGVHCVCVCVCVCVRARVGAMPKTSCSNCEVQHSDVLRSFVSETMSSEFERLSGKTLSTSTLIHSFFWPALYVRSGSHCLQVVLAPGSCCGLDLIPAPNAFEWDLGEETPQRTNRLLKDVVYQRVKEHTAPN